MPAGGQARAEMAGMGIGAAPRHGVDGKHPGGIRLELLGGFRVFVGEKPVCQGLPSRKAETLVAYLYSGGEVGCVPRDELCRVLWPPAVNASGDPDDADAARKRLKQAVALARRALGNGAESLLPRDGSDGGRHLLPRAPGVDTDVRRFEAALHAASRSRSEDEAAPHWRDALALYAGPFLPAASEPWAEAERERLAYRRRSALLHLMRWHEQRGDIPDAVALARQACALDPLDEEAVADLMRLLALSGRRAEALQVGRRFEAALQSAWGADAAASGVREIQAHIRAGKRIAPGWPAPPPANPASPAGPGRMNESDLQDARRLLAEMQRHGIVAPREAAPEAPSPLLDALGKVAAAMSGPDREGLRRRHADAWLTRLRQAAASDLWHGPAAEREYALLDRSGPEVAAALGYLEDRKPGDALALAAGLYGHGYSRGTYAESRARLERLLAAASPEVAGAHAAAGPEVRAEALLAAGHFANCMGDNRNAVARYREARALYEGMGDRDGVALSLMREGNAMQESGLYAEAYRLCAEAERHFRARGDEPRLLLSLFYTAQAAELAGDLETFRAMLPDQVNLARSLRDDRFNALMLYGASLSPATRGENLSQCAVWLGEALGLLEGRRDVFVSIYVLQLLASLLAVRGQANESVTVSAAVRGLRRLHRHPEPHAERADPLRFNHPAALRLRDSGSRRAAAALGRDLACSLPEALAFAREALGR